MIITFALGFLVASAIWIIRALQQLNRKITILMATAAEANAKLDEISATLTKVSGETSALLAAIAELQAAAAGNVPDDIMARIDAIAVQTKSIDDQVTDLAPPATP